MKVFRNYYGASVDRGIGVQAQSAELSQLNLDGILRELSSFHALESSEHDKEMLSYLVEKGGYSILGVSYTEQPKASGYNRSAPCGLQYVVRTDELAEVSTELGSIINFVSFQKPDSANPTPLSSIPRNDSGYTFHNSPSVIASIIDGLIRVALSPDGEIMIIALPKGKNSEYASARYAIAELLCYLPVSLRMNIRFFTGLPVQEGKTNPIEGLDNAVRFGANVIFCPNEYYRTLISHHKCYGVDMDQPGGKAGMFAQFIASAPDISDGLAAVLSNQTGALTYDTINDAADKARSGGKVSIDSLQRRLAEVEKERRRCDDQLMKNQADLQKFQHENERLHRYCEDLKNQNKKLNQQNTNLNQQYENLNQQYEKIAKAHSTRSAKQQQADYNEYEVKNEYPVILKIMLAFFAAVFLMAAAVLVYNGTIRGFSKVFDFSGIQRVIPEPSQTKNVELPSNMTDTGKQLQESNAEPQGPYHESEETDTGAQGSDNGSEGTDAGVQGSDNGSEEIDGGVQGSDNELEETDGGVQGSDNELEETDGELKDSVTRQNESDDMTGSTPENTTAKDIIEPQFDDQTGFSMDPSAEKPEDISAAESTVETIEKQETSIDSEYTNVSESFAEKKAVVSDTHVNFREGASTTAKFIKKLPNGTEMTVIEELVGKDREKWYKVSCDGTEGYVMAKYVEIIGETP